MKLKELFTDSDKWTKNTLARDAEDFKVDVNNPNAVKWCLGGGILRCYEQSGQYLEICQKIHDYIYNHFVANDIVQFNDYVASFHDIKEMVETLDI